MGNFTKIRDGVVKAVLGAAILYGAWFLLFVIIGDKLTNFDRALDKSFRGVELNQSRAEVITALGDPIDEGEEFYLAQDIGFEEEYRKAEQSSAKYFLNWSNGIDFIYVVGFDESDFVVYKARGGS